MDMTKIKKAESLSTLNEIDNKGGNESKTKEKEKFQINTNAEDTKPKIEPRAANEFPQILASLLFLFNTNDPAAPTVNKSRAVKNMADEEMALNILFFTTVNHFQNFEQMTQNGFW